MNEKEIAESKVIPFLEKLGWPKQLITQYGKVPVQMGTEVKWADIVALFVDENDSAIPYLVIEVKTALIDINRILAQTDSYSKLLDAQYFAVTDGEDYLFYHRRLTGGYMKINNVPIPDRVHLTATKYTKFRTGFILCARPNADGTRQPNQYTELEKEIDRYFDLVTANKYYLGRSETYSLRKDVTWHYRSVKWIHSLIHDNIDSMTPKEFKDGFEYNIMCYKPPNIKRIYSEIDNNFNKVRSFLRFIRDFQGDAEENLDRLFDPTDELHVDGMGPFVISQFLAAAHPRDYTIIEDRMVNTMKNLDLIDTKVKSNTAKGYLYINDICRKLLSEIFGRKIEEHSQKLGFRVDSDFGLIVVHEFFWEYEEFSSYDVTKLEEATGERRRTEEVETDLNLESISQLM